MDHFYERIEGWFDFQELYTDMVAAAPNVAHFVEVGCHHGRSAAFMAVEIANSGKQIQFDCVDPWDGRSETGTGYNNNLAQFMLNLEPATGFFTAIQAASPEAAESYAKESLDFVFIDAIHLYENHHADILAWLPKIKTGGYIGGHDYVKGHSNGIERAVSELLPDHKVYEGSLVGTWLYHKNTINIV